MCCGGGSCVGDAWCCVPVRDMRPPGLRDGEEVLAVKEQVS